MYILRFSFLMLVFLPTLLVSGCASAYPIDLELVSVSAKDHKYQEELPPPSGSPEKYFENLDYSKPPMRAMGYKSEDKPHRLVLKVEFQSKENLARLRTDHHFVLAKQAFFCEHPKVPVLLGGSSIYWKGINLSHILQNPIPQDELDRPVVYYTFLDVRYDFLGQSSFEKFDLLKKAKDICFQLKGGNNSGLGYESNVVVIPKAEIIRALEQMPPELRESTAQ